MSSIKESGKISSDMAMEYRYGLMGLDMKVFGFKAKLMDMVNCLNQTEICMKDSLHMISEMVRAL